MDNEKFIDVRKIIKDKNPKHYRWMPWFLINYVERILHQKEINAFLLKHKNDYNVDFCVERLDYNRDYCGQKSKYINLMKRGDEEIYNKFIKYNIEKDIVDAVVEYGEGKLGGEVLFVSKQN